MPQLNNVNWAKLVRENRAKAPGVQWSDEEAKAVYINKVDPNIVRAGFLTEEKYLKAKEKAKEADKYSYESLKLLSEKEVITLAKKLKIDFVEGVASKNDIIALIVEKAESKTDSKKASKKKASKTKVRKTL